MQPTSHRAYLAAQLCHEQGVDIRIIQDLLGHRHINTTTRYARVALNTIRQIESPLDALKIELRTST
jgi:site-specific recombinase XerD